MRYINNKIQTNTGKTRLQTTILPNIVAAGDAYIETTSIDRLDIIAKNFYSNETYWWVIAVANGLGKGSLVIPPGTVLRIPNVNEVMSYVTRKNAIR